MKAAILLLFVFFFTFLSQKTIAQEKKAKDDLAMCESYYTDSSLFDKAVFYGKKALKKAVNHKDKLKIGLALKYIGLAYSKNYIDFDSAKIYLTKAESFCKKNGLKNEIPEIQLGIGRNYLLSGNIDQASTIFYSVLKIFEQKKDIRLRAITEKEIGRMFLIQNKYDLALTQFKKAYKLWNEAKDYTGASYEYLNISTVLMFQKKYKESLNMVKKSIKIYPNLKSGYGYSRYMNRLSVTYLAINDFPRALEICKKELLHAKKLNLRIETQDLIRNLGYIYLQMGNIEAAKKMFPDVQANIKRYNSTLGRSFDYKYLSDVSFAAGDYKEAYSNLELSKQYQDSVLIESSQNKILELKEIYESEKKDQVINNLENEKKLARYQFYWIFSIVIIISLMLLLIMNYFRAKYKREKHVKEVEFLENEKKIKGLEIQILHAQMNPHFVFNCLTAIEHLFMKGDRILANSKLNSFSHLLRMSIDHVKHNFVSLENELIFLKYFVDLEQLQFKEEFGYRVINNCGESLSDIEIPSMILQPFVENAINHGFKNKKTDCLLIIELNEENNILLVNINDNGVGREEAGRIKKMSNFNHVSKGLFLVNEKIQALKDISGLEVKIETIDLIDSLNNSMGTRVNISIPI